MGFLASRWSRSVLCYKVVWEMDFVAVGFCWQFLWQNNTARFEIGSCSGERVFGWTPHPATLHKKQPRLIVTSPKHYPRKKNKKNLFFDIRHLVSHYWVYMSSSLWWQWFVRLNTHPQADGQLYFCNNPGKLLGADQHSYLCVLWMQTRAFVFDSGGNRSYFFFASLVNLCATLLWG